MSLVSCTSARAKGIKAMFLGGQMKKKANKIRRAAHGEYQIICACPEMLESLNFAPILYSPHVKARLAAICFDEAHCLVEMARWRGAYERVKYLRPAVLTKERKIPILATSATLPPNYVAHLRTMLDLSDKSKVLNLGNHRPELSTVVMSMQHPMNSFKDLSFLLPPSPALDTIHKTIVYCDKISRLYQMRRWVRGMLRDIGLPTRLVDIYHAGLSRFHKRRAMNRFNLGNTCILLATEAVGMGMNFSAVRYVVQYGCAGLTYSQVVQRFGRAARDKGGWGVGFLLVESRMDERGKLSPLSPGTEDPGLLQLIQSTHCCDQIAKSYFKNPLEPLSFPTRRCCSRCDRSLIPTSHAYTYIMETGQPNEARKKSPLTHDERSKIFMRLQKWRLQFWKDNWDSCEDGPLDIVDDGGLMNIARRAAQIKTASDINRFAQIACWSRVGHPLYAAFKEAWKAETSLPLPSETETSAPKDLPQYDPTEAQKSLRRTRISAVQREQGYGAFGSYLILLRKTF